MGLPLSIVSLQFTSTVASSFLVNLCANIRDILRPIDTKGREEKNHHFALILYERISLSLRPFVEILLRFDSENGKLVPSR